MFSLPFSAWALPWGIGVGLASPNPWELSVALRPEDYVVRLAGGGWVENRLGGWGGARLSAGKDWIGERWYGLETNLGCGYFKAQAADSMHIAVNDANGAHVLYEASWEESWDAGLELAFRVFALRAAVGAPLWSGGNHRPRLYWNLGVVWMLGTQDD